MPKFLAGATSSARPRVLLVAGAPGSGKTTAADRIQALAFPHAVRVCADLLKPEHPHYAPALAVDELHAGRVVRADTRRWAQELAARARLRGADVVEETALDDPRALREVSAAYRLAGYRIHLLVLDVPSGVGQLRITVRHLQHARRCGAVRYVSAAHRAACADRLPDTLAVAENERLADRVTVVGYEGRVLYRNVLADGSWAVPHNAAAVVTATRKQLWQERARTGFDRAAATVARELRKERLTVQRRLRGTEDLEAARVLAARQQPMSQTGEGFGCLPQGQRQRIFDRDIVPLHLNDITAHKDPHVIYVMSQPGGNKSVRSREIMNRYASRTPTLISSDFLKAAHPDYRRLAREDPRMAGAIIRADYTFWRRLSEARVRERRGDAVIETAPGTPEEFCSSVADFAAAGYRITLVVVAVRAADSRQATARRYLEQIRHQRPARFTTASGHDQCFTTVTLCTAIAVHMQPVAAIQVVDRGGHPLSTTNSTTVSAPVALDAERSRPYTQAEAELFLSHQAELAAHLPQHRAELDDIAALAAPLLPTAPPEDNS
ncbi:zeta toxin family protein [Streptomyces sp. NPDC048508]|uniref:zeta toxin family protein n=1 Tax=Streptomyces sp. NPDC048508 TaxID=3365561 RepID=UPI0037231CD7